MSARLKGSIDRQDASNFQELRISLRNANSVSVSRSYNEVFMNGHSSAKSLFGGAIKTVFPDHFLDASYFPSLCKWLMPRNFRSVPDNQEVFVSNLDDTSIIFDILEQVPASDASAAEFHFDALAVDNEVDEEDDSRVFSTRSLASSEHSKLPSVPCYTLAGYQRIVK